MKRFLILFLMVLCGHCISGQEFEWLISSGYYAQCRSGASDNNGNVYFVGEFVQNVQFGDTVLYATGNNYEIFMVKYDTSGNFCWARSAGSTGNDYCFEAITDDEGYVYITGNFSGTATFGSFILTSYGSNDIYLAKYSPDGECLWIVQAGGSYYFDNSMTLDLDVDNNIFLTGCFEHTAVFGDTTLSSGFLSTGNPNAEWGGDIFVAKYTEDGEFLWAKYIAGNDHANRGHGIACDSENNFYLSGKFEGELYFDTDTLVSAGDFDIFLAKFDGDGNFLWANRAGSTTHDKPSPSGMKIDEDDHVYITGYFQDIADFSGQQVTSHGGWDLFLAKYKPDGTVVWVKSEGGNEDDRAYSMTIKDASLYLTGFFMENPLFGNSYPLSSNGGKDIFVAKYDTAGNFYWADDHGGPGEDWAYQIHQDNGNGFYLGGFHNDQAVFGDTILYSVDYQNLFFGRFLDTTCMVNVNQQESNQMPFFYPNPSIGKIHFSIQDAPLFQEYSLTVYRMNGELVRTIFIRNDHEVDLSDLPGGLYLIRIQGNDFNGSGKILLLECKM